MPFISLKDIQAKEMVPGYLARFVHSENMTFSYWDVKAGSIMPEHIHTHEQINILIEGEFELTIEGEERKVLPGMVNVIPSNSKHSGKAITDCIIMDVFSPVREDYKYSD